MKTCVSHGSTVRQPRTWRRQLQEFGVANPTYQSGYASLTDWITRALPLGSQLLAGVCDRDAASPAA